MRHWVILAIVFVVLANITIRNTPVAILATADVVLSCR